MGKAEASIEPPPLAAVCWRDVQHATPILGEEAASLLAREGAQLDIARQDKRDCRVIEQGWRLDAANLRD